ncbi:heme o synthase [Natrinema salsiterrestre]|uniref:Protoheme IX farnesyltransferase n=1 Tax=Natrinema salsiterrestre TaxID=2950540 RepID=A0A9Q4Q2L4_9EURY|nr:heme o synthase [Natrinema salsiterrestre]MDF9746641.1 heme o synthase [Natrinema salsiterrestre]
MIDITDRRRFADLLATTTVAAYVLVALGTAVSTTDSAPTCSTFLGCSSDPAHLTLSGEVLLFWGHRLAALVTGVLVAASGLAVRKAAVGRRAARLVGCVVVLFPVQIALGAAIVVGSPAIARTVHLALAMLIFACLLLALVRTLDDHPREETAPSVNGPASSSGEQSERVSAASDDDIGETATSSERATGSVSRLRRTAGAYLTLTKPRLMWLLCLVALAGMGLATLTGAPLEPTTAIATLAGGVLAIGASGTFNHVYERDRDRRMNRTNDRPLVHDLVPARNALVFGLALAATSTIVLVTWVNALAAALTFAAIVYYAVLYTVLLKPNTAWNTVLGGGAGALPAVIGWAAVTGTVGAPALALAAVIFLWTPAHFYSLAIAFREDYARGGFPMYPVVEGVPAARRHVAFYLGATLLAASVLGWIAGLGWVYAVTSIALGSVFLRSVIRQYRTPTDEVALRSFYVSNYYLGAILLAIVLETLLVAA